VTSKHNTEYYLKQMLQVISMFIDELEDMNMKTHNFVYY